MQPGSIICFDRHSAVSIPPPWKPTSSSHRGTLRSPSQQSKLPILLTFISRLILKHNTHSVSDVVPEAILLPNPNYWSGPNSKSDHYNRIHSTFSDQDQDDHLLLQFLMHSYPHSIHSPELFSNILPEIDLHIFSWIIFLQGTWEQRPWQTSLSSGCSHGVTLMGTAANRFLPAPALLIFLLKPFKCKHINTVCQT